MKKVIRLTESDLARIVKRVISENNHDEKEHALKVFRTWVKKNAHLKDTDELSDNQIVGIVKKFGERADKNEIIYMLWKQNKKFFKD